MFSSSVHSNIAHLSAWLASSRCSCCQMGPAAASCIASTRSNTAAAKVASSLMVACSCLQYSEQRDAAVSQVHQKNV